YGTVSPADAATVAGRDFSTVKNMDGNVLELRGTGLFRYLAAIKVVAGAFYVDPVYAHRDPLSADVPKQIELSYFLSIDAEDFAEVTHQGIRQNVDFATYAKLKDRIDRFNTFYRDVKSGDRYTLTYIPGQGTTLALNGVATGTISGRAFAEAIFRIWLGDKPMDERFKNDLLTKGKSTASTDTPSSSNSEAICHV
ncbi:chalcone isomerase family protein, partial [bacterium]|nr:chalcone isomerase family protein [bacterium]